MLALIYSTLLPLAIAPPEADEFDAKVKKATETAVAALKKLQKEDGRWEKTANAPATGNGGWTALAVLALLESGAKTDDPAVAKGLKVLRGLKPSFTYTVGLQTAALCKVNDKQD